MKFLHYLLLLISTGLFTACREDTRHRIIISIPRQTLTLLRDGAPIANYPVSTSKFGTGDNQGTNFTPLGEFKIRKKIGDSLPIGAVMKSRKFTGEILPINAPGRDPIVTRILWLDGLEPKNRNAFSRYIYIHGTPEERTIGKPSSYGCIRMRSRDIIALYNIVGIGARVFISQDNNHPDQEIEILIPPNSFQHPTKQGQKSNNQLKQAKR